jgi:UDP-N-acetylmuramoyl-L-alanyl-D-glutamate--2,6-diaminopimelate ligase
VADRKEAIKTAIKLAGKGDIVLVAGKGHEKYQEIKGVKYEFDDKQVVKELFELLNR